MQLHLTQHKRFVITHPNPRPSAKGVTTFMEEIVRPKGWLLSKKEVLRI